MLKESNHAALPEPTTFALNDDLISLPTTATAHKKQSSLSVLLYGDWPPPASTLAGMRSQYV